MHGECDVLRAHSTSRARPTALAPPVNPVLPHVSHTTIFLMPVVMTCEPILIRARSLPGYQSTCAAHSLHRVLIAVWPLLPFSGDSVVDLFDRHVPGILGRQANMKVSRQCHVCW